jgi:hypothetical protein
MTHLYTPDSLWRERFNELARDVSRLEALLDHNLIQQETGLGGKLSQLLSQLKVHVQDLKQRDKAGVAAPQLWADLVSRIRECRALCAAQLELLGGVALSYHGFDDGFVKQAQQWLVAFRDRLGLSQPVSVIAGRGTLLESDIGVVRLSFPDWDLWHLPLLARALGLLAAAPGSKYSDALQPFIHAPTEQIKEILGAVAQRCQFVQYLFADMFATAIVGPVYALAVFALELDYSNPHQFDLLDPDQIEGREAAPRFLPAPVHRAAAMLATLQAMNGADERPPSKRPYTQIIKCLEELWRAAIQSAGRPDPLDSRSRSDHAWHQAIYDEVIRPLALLALQKTEQTWQQAMVWHKALRSGAWPAASTPETTALVSAIWQLRLEHPEQADNALGLANALLRGKQDLSPLGTASTFPAKAIAQVRAERLAQCWQRIACIVQDERISSRAAVAGRFYRLLSEQECKLEPWQVVIQGETLRTSIWGKLSELAEAARPVQREALEFLGGWLVRQHQLDREPASLSQSPHPGASICDLADELLRDYARRTAVNWNARTVLGLEPFLEANTEIIRVRFPDWSLWNLPLMAHEFGHLVARSTPEFLEYQRQQREQCLEGHPHPETANQDQRCQHLDEFFADIFATYTLGPAFACDVILLQFNPVEAHEWRGAHPSHQERVQVILQTLSAMNRQVRSKGMYLWVLTQLQQCWDQMRAACQATPVDGSLHDFACAQSLRRGRKLYGFVDKFYHLGAAYTAKRWAGAQKIAKRLLKLPVPSLEEITHITKGDIADGFALGDLLNAVWYARVTNPEPPIDLTAVAHQLARYYLRE